MHIKIISKLAKFLASHLISMSQQIHDKSKVDLMEILL